MDTRTHHVTYAGQAPLDIPCSNALDPRLTCPLCGRGPAARPATVPSHVAWRPEWETFEPIASADDLGSH